jgi:hypothetical protein
MCLASRFNRYLSEMVINLSDAIYLQNLLLQIINEPKTTNYLITDIGNKKVQSIGKNYNIETECKKLYPMHLLLV